MNIDKCHLLISGYNHENIWVKIRNEIIWESNTVRLLGVAIDSDLKFPNYFSELSNKQLEK